MPSSDRSGDRLVFVLGLALACALLGYLFGPVLACGTQCVADPIPMRVPGLGNLELADIELNAWILSWVQHSLLTNPTGLFDPNIFHPAERVLVQSEHMVSVAASLLPLRLLTDDALVLHFVALLSSSVVLSITTLGLVRWLSGSNVAAVVAGLATLLMPWRFTELTHVQLLGVHLFPVVWWGMVRCTDPDVGKGPRIALALALAYQLLASFYLAYFLLMTCAAVGVALLIHRRIDRASALRLGLSLAPGALALLAFAWPYLEWSRGPGFQAGAIVDTTLKSLDVLRLTAPGVPWRGLRYPFETTYQIPFAVLALAVLAIPAARRADAPSQERILVLGLWLASVFGFVLELGRVLELGSVRIPLPAAFLAQWVPGFDQLRGPLRWAIPIGVAMPVLAGLGLAQLLRGAGAARAVAVASLALLALELIPPPLPSRDLWEGREEHRAAYAALAARPPGPVVVLPWHLEAMRDLSASSHYVLGSTLHWKPILNGHSGYFPPGYALLRRVAQELPSAAGVARLHALSGVRFLLVHEEELLPGQRRAWSDAVASGQIRRVDRHGESTLYELTDWTPGGRYSEALARPALRARTLTGLERAPLAPAARRGRLELVSPAPLQFAGVPLPAATHVSLRIRNDGTGTWPGFDPDPAGLVQLRVTFRGRDSETTSLVPLTADVPPEAAIELTLPIFPPAREGRYRLHLELVQQVDGEPVRLDVPALEVGAVVTDIRARLRLLQQPGQAE
jgi:hypothetical protein